MNALETLAAVVVGGLIAPIGNILFAVWKGRNDRRNLSVALGAEISTILSLSERRRYEQFFRDWLESWNKGQGVNENPGIHGFDGNYPDPVFDSSVERIGLLGHSNARDVGRFYSTIKGIRGDIAALSRGDVSNIEQKISMIEEDLELWRELKELGNSLVSRLAK